jgi:predicted RNA binding protein YcfA (HicA-like mRNA interferase family)
VTGKFPVDAPIENVIKALKHLGFQVARQGNHIALLRENEDGSSTPMTIPNHRKIKGSTLRTILTQAGIPRAEFLTAYEEG